MARVKIPKIRAKNPTNPTNPQIREIIRRLKSGYHILQQKKITGEVEGVSIGGIGDSSQLQNAVFRFPEGTPPLNFSGGPSQQVQKAELTPPNREEIKEEDVTKGVEIPTETRPLKPLLVSEEEKEALKQVNIFYNLIPRFPKEGDTIFAYANLKWNSASNTVVYSIVEPPITPAEMRLIKDIKKQLEERLDIDFTKLGEVKSKELLRDEIKKILSTLTEINPSRINVLTYYIEKETIGMGRIEAMMNDADIEDISCDGINIPLYIYHRDPRFASLKTNIVFSDIDELNNFVLKLAQKCNKTISIADPLLDGALPDGSRVQATLGTDIARKGSNFTIRKFTEKPLTPIHMLRYHTLNSLQLAYLWLAIENGKSILISGGTATGKTSMLNALSLFITPTAKVVSIEDTSELRLPHPHWVPEVARSPLSIKGKVGEVTLFDLLKSSLRQRPDYIVLGEVRGREAFVLFQQMATGHPSLATIHAASLLQLIDRLITPPISLPPSLIENIDIIVFLTLSKLKGAYIRRADTIQEITGIRGENPITNKIFKWKPLTDTYATLNKSIVLKKISERLGATEEFIKEEIIRRKIILEWMLEQEIFDYREVSKVIDTYYATPDRLIELVSRSE